MHPAVADVLEPAHATRPPGAGAGLGSGSPQGPRIAPGVKWALVAALVVLVVLGGMAVAAVVYDRSTDDKLLPGVRVAGIDVGGQEPGSAVQTVNAQLRAEGGKAIPLAAGAVRASHTLDQLGLEADTAAVVARAEDDAREMGLVRRVWHRLRDEPVEGDYPVRFRLDRNRVATAVSALARKVDRDPADAKIDTSSGLVNVVPAVVGQALEQRTGIDQVVQVGERVANEKTTVGPSGIEIPVRPRQPKVTAYPDIILIRTGENRLYHYENHALARTYVVATGTAQYPTPTGRFSIVLKRRNPTWVNPDPGGWGRSMPATIGPGPSNPLGTRALNLSAPGIRIHGTSNVASLGTNASHGCIRMSIPDSEALFERVEAGTPVIILQGPAAPKPAPAASGALGPFDLGSG